MKFEEGDIVLCTVDRIVGTVVFVKIEDKVEGSIVMSEVAPGRIRNIRDYVVPKKKIVCKIIRISQNGHIDLSLRRVTQKEAKEVKEKAEEEQSYAKILKSIVKEKAEEIIKKIGENNTLYDFFQKSRQEPGELENIFGKNNAKKILDILNAQKNKKYRIKKEIFLSSTDPEGLSKIKEVFGGLENAKVKYLSGGRYTVESESVDIKSADSDLRRIAAEIEKKAKNKGMEFSIKEK